MIGNCHVVDVSEPYEVDESVQLICKYLQAKKDNEIDTEYVEGRYLKHKGLKHVYLYYFISKAQL